MNKIVINIPESVNLKDFDPALYIASKMYEDSLISAGQAAEMVGMSKRSFIEIMSKYGVSMFSQSLDELRIEIANA
jgi:predicted HTH domain antitoxin